MTENIVAATAPKGQADLNINKNPPQWQDPAAKFTCTRNLLDGLEMTTWAAQCNDSYNIRLGIRLMLCALSLDEMATVLQAAVGDLAARGVQDE
jgi:hypothetical protein